MFHVLHGILPKEKAAGAACCRISLHSLPRNPGEVRNKICLCSSFSQPDNTSHCGLIWLVNRLPCALRRAMCPASGDDVPRSTRTATSVIFSPLPLPAGPALLLLRLPLPWCAFPLPPPVAGACGLLFGYFRRSLSPVRPLAGQCRAVRGSSSSVKTVLFLYEYLSIKYFPKRI